MRIVNSAEEMPKEFEEARNEAKKAFGDDKIFVEKYLRDPKHIEVQVLGDKYGNVVHLFDRDCSVQRRHQKVIEFAPAFTVSQPVREKILADAVRLSKHVGYKNAGTLEFLVDADENYYFIEMNPRIQVEHTVSEEVTGIDIVQAQILIEEGYPLGAPEIGIFLSGGCTLQRLFRSAAYHNESPANNFMPDTGKINVYRSPAGNGIRLDGGTAHTGAEVTPYYDSLLVKIIAHDRTFKGVTNKAIRAIKETPYPWRKKQIFLSSSMFCRAKPGVKGNVLQPLSKKSPELFRFVPGKDRASKIAEFIGNQIVNESKGQKPQFDPIVVPSFGRPKMAKPLSFRRKGYFPQDGRKGHIHSLL